jgi:integrase
MSKILLRYVHAFRDRHGRMRYYFRRPGFKRVPLPGLPGSDEFMSAYQKMLDPKTAPKVEPGADRIVRGSVSDVVVQYYASPEFRGLADSSKRARRNVLERFREKHGDKSMATLTRKHVKQLLAEKAETPAAANYWLKMIRRLVEVAIEAGYRKDDPTVAVKFIRTKSDGHPVWSDADIAAFRARHPLGTRQRLAMEMGLATMQRRSDLCRMGRQHLNSGVMTIRQVKTGMQVSIPVLPELLAAIDLLPADQLTFLVTEAGRPFTPAGLGNWFRDACTAAGLPSGFNTHGLRKAGATRGAEAGWTDHEIMAFGGWSSISEVQRYTKNANRKRLAQSAVHKLTPRTGTGKPE